MCARSRCHRGAGTGTALQDAAEPRARGSTDTPKNCGPWDCLGAASLPTQPLGPGVPHTFWDPKAAVTAWDTQIPSRAKPAPLGAAPQQPGWEEERPREFGLFVPF